MSLAVFSLQTVLKDPFTGLATVLTASIAVGVLSYIMALLIIRRFCCRPIWKDAFDEIDTTLTEWLGARRSAGAN